MDEHDYEYDYPTKEELELIDKLNPCSDVDENEVVNRLFLLR